MQGIDKKLFAQFFKRRSVPFGQHLGDRTEIEDDDLAEKYLRDALPLIGEVVFAFSTLERMLARHLCEIINDRTDEPGLIVLQGMMFRQRVDLFERLCRSFHAAFASPAEHAAHTLLGPLVAELREVGEMRNRVVHADWGSIDDRGFAFVKVNMTARGLHEDHMRVDQESLDALVGRIAYAMGDLDAYLEARVDLRMLASKPVGEG